MNSTEIHNEKPKYNQVIRSSPEQALSSCRKQQNNQKQHNSYSIMDSIENHKKIKYKQVIRSSPEQVLSSWRKQLKTRKNTTLKASWIPMELIKENQNI